MASMRDLLDRLALAKRVVRETPVVSLADDRVELFAKLEYLNGIGSIKDRPALWILKNAIERGEVGPGTTIIESSSGNFACALATFAKLLELDFIPVIDPTISPLYESSLRSQCRRVVKVDDRDDAGGYLKSRLRMVERLRSEIPDAFWPNQYGNPDGMDAHYRMTGEEIVRALPDLDYVFLAVSSAGTIAGTSRRLKEHNPRIKIIAVDAEGSVIFNRPAGQRWIPGLGSSITPPLLRHALVDDVVMVSEPDTIVACNTLLHRHGLFVGGSTGSSYAAVQRYFVAPARGARPRVLFLCGDRGGAYLHNVFDRHWSAWRATADQPVTPAVEAH
jgi:2,3-diaminopropionate biosynthesis protein SbnA